MNAEDTKQEAIQAAYELVNLAAVLRQCRKQVCEAYFTGKHPAALAALAAVSIRLYRLVEDGTLRGEVALEELWDVADNLKLIDLCGEQAVEIAIDAGPRFYDALFGGRRELSTPPANQLAKKLHETFNRKMAGGENNRPTPQATIDAIMHAVRQRGVAALQEADTKERLTRCDSAARKEINKRIEKLIADGHISEAPNAA